ncbi:hypothetical protein D2M30_2699 [Bacillus amyloliquefaciens]|nr:hypothetical protein D2M30_2699 [Bacillus amyloliquefaciens]
MGLFISHYGSLLPKLATNSKSGMFLIRPGSFLSFFSIQGSG